MKYTTSMALATQTHWKLFSLYFCFSFLGESYLFMNAYAERICNSFSGDVGIAAMSTGYPLKMYTPKTQKQS